MKIEKIKKISNDKYKIEFDNKEKLITYDKVILDNNLLFNKEVDNNLLNELMKESDYYSNYNKVVKYINTKIRSEEEIKNYLDKMIIPEIDKKKIIDNLKQSGLINDINFVKAFVSDKIRLSNIGPNKIKQELLKHNIDINIIEEEINNYDIKYINEKLEKLIIKKINLNHKYSNYILTQKLITYFIDLGYYKEDIVELIEKNISNNDNIIKKEYEIQKRKLEKKYNDDELKFKIIQKLYQKGFSKEDIEKVDN